MSGRLVARGRGCKKIVECFKRNTELNSSTTEFLFAQILELYYITLYYGLIVAIGFLDRDFGAAVVSG